MASKCRDSWLAYLDILGYTELVEGAVEAGTDTESIDKLRGSLDRALGDYRKPQRKSASRPVTAEWDVHVLSDSVVLSMRKLPVLDIVATVIQVMYVQAYLAVDGVLVRGAITCGQHYDDGELLFSPALITGYKAEKALALHPRIILDRTARTEFRDIMKGDYGLPPEAPEQPGDLVWLDGDGMAFVNYLAVVDEYDDEYYGLQYLKAHRDQVEAKLAQFPQRDDVLRKIRWVAGYHNAYCRHRLPQDAVAEYLVSDDPRLGPWLSKGGILLSSEEKLYAGPASDEACDA